MRPSRSRRASDSRGRGRIRLGRRGERVAEKLLRRAGLIVLARNWRGGGGELDLTVLDGDTLVFVEVKTRTAGFDDPRQPVSVSQRRRIRQAANAFRRRYAVPDLPARFDLVTVSLEAPSRTPGSWDPRSWAPRGGSRATKRASAEWHRNYQRNNEHQEHR